MPQKKESPKKLFMVANRLPVIIKRKKSQLNFQQSPGGLASGLRSFKKANTSFIGWPGLWPFNEKERNNIEQELRARFNCFPVFLSPSDLEKYYYGFTNRTVWPLFHYFSTYCAFEKSDWEAYKRVNQKFANKVSQVGHSRDVFWIHDYHLMLLPGLLRKKFPESSIGFFLHIPFPSSEVFRTLPWRKEILEGLLGADLIGFHTYEYARHFLSAVLRLLGIEHKFGSVTVDNRIVRVDNFPMGIDFRNITDKLKHPSIRKEVQKLKNQTGAQKRKIVLSVDRMDYTKGIPQRLEGIEYFLEKHPEWRGRFIYIMLSVPSRTTVKHYILLKEEVDRLVGRINGRFGRPDWMPIHYMYRSLPFLKLLPLYSVADVALVSPLRDGMNLVAKEFIASQTDKKGVLVLSETTGASAELGEALLVNTNNKEEISKALFHALEMRDEEKEKRMESMRSRLSEYDIFQWIDSFIEGIEHVKALQAQREHLKLSPAYQEKLLIDFKGSEKRLLLLDYDGTLLPFSSKPEDAKPDGELLKILRALATDPHNKLVIISGRDKTTLEKWLKNIPCSIVAEHGAKIRKRPDSNWESQVIYSSEWKKEILPILKTYSIRVPGSFVEEKEYSLAWHYRKSNPELGKLRSSELFDILNEFLANTDLQVMHGNKVIEVRSGGINKGEAARYFLSLQNWDFILAIGDDWTDEDLFKILPPSAYAIKIGYQPTKARFYLESSKACRNLLHKLIESTKETLA